MTHQALRSFIALGPSAPAPTICLVPVRAASRRRAVLADRARAAVRRVEYLAGRHRDLSNRSRWLVRAREGAPAPRKRAAAGPRPLRAKLARAPRDRLVLWVLAGRGVLGAAAGSPGSRSSPARDPPPLPPLIHVQKTITIAAADRGRLRAGGSLRRTSRASWRT